MLEDLSAADIEPGAMLSLTAEQRDELVASLTDDEALELAYNWRAWARPDQIAPSGNWRTWLALAGRGWGKTRTGAEWVRAEVEAGRAGRVALIGATASDVRDTMIQGESGLLAISPSWSRPTYHPSKRSLEWPNGAIALCFSSEEPDRLRGPQASIGWLDELAAWHNMRETWDNYLFGLRLGDNPRSYISTTPRPIPLLRELIADPGTIVTRGRTMDNAANLAASAVAELMRKYSGTRLGRQELNGEILTDTEGALWSWGMIEKARTIETPRGGYRRVVIGVDPSGTSGTGNRQGIVCAGLGADGHFYVIEDGSVAASPERWAAKVVELYDRHRADRVIAERNYGGDLVASVLAQVRRNLPVRMVTATRGKAIRAEPCAALYEQGRVRHLGVHDQLEGEMVQMTSAGYMGEGSPDRLDALVWSLTELSSNASTGAVLSGGI